MARRHVSAFVYFMRLGEFVKIGSTCNVERRLRAFRSLPYPCELLHHFPSEDALGVEIALHWRFNRERVRREWFRLSDEQVERLRQVERCDSVALLPADLQPPSRMNNHGIEGKLVNVRLSAELLELVQAGADALDADVPSLVLRVLSECVPQYKRLA